MPRRYNEPAVPEWLALPIVLILVAFIGFIIVKALVDVEPEFGTVGWGIYGTTVSAITLFTAYSWLQKLRGPRW
jgi:hypothetical protein